MRGLKQLGKSGDLLIIVCYGAKRVSAWVLKFSLHWIYVEMILQMHRTRLNS